MSSSSDLKEMQHHSDSGLDVRSRVQLLFVHVKTLWPMLLGNVLEWYEYSIYGALVPQVTANFFHGSASAAWMGFAVNFVVRPLGGFAFGWAADRFGRRNASVLSVLGMLIATVGQGLVPSSYCCGPAAGKLGTVLILALRGLQGFSVGGESASLLPYIVETAPGQIKYMAASMYMVTLCFSFFLANSFAFLLTLLLDESDMMLWGWRIPFIICLLPGTVSLWGRRNLPESPEFLKWQEQQKQQLELKESQKQSQTSGAENVGSSLHRTCSFCREHAAGLLVVLVGSAPLPVAWNQALWMLSYLTSKGLPLDAAQGIGAMMQIVCAVMAISMATLTDMKGFWPGRPVMLGTLCLILAWVPLFGLVVAFPSNLGAAALGISLGFGLVLGLAGGTYHTFFVLQFPTEVRGRLFGAAWNISLAAFSGFTGAISQGLSNTSPLGPALYVSGLSLVGFATLLWAKRTQEASCKFDAQRQVDEDDVESRRAEGIA